LTTLGRELPLGIGKLPRFELQIARLATLRFRSTQPPFEILELLERPAAAGPGLLRIRPAQFARRVAHVVRNLAQLPGRLIAARRRRSRRTRRILLPSLGLRHPPRQILGLAPKLGLFPRQLFELARHLGISALIVMPETTPEIKV